VPSIDIFNTQDIINMENIVMSDDIDWLMITGAEEEHQDVLLQIIKIWITI